jgi:hypothetical protein
MLNQRGKSDKKFTEKLRNEVFQVDRDKNYALHEILMGGTSDRNAYAATLAILDISNKYPLEQQKMLAATPPSHLRTPLHWAAWGNAEMEILQALVKGNPEALIVRDKKSQGQRTPLEILKRYFGTNTALTQLDYRKVPFLEIATASWISHRVGLALHLAANRYFGRIQRHESRLVPFDKGHQKAAGIKPKPWFVLSVIGYLLQREMKPLALNILSYVGGNAKVRGKTNKRPSARSKNRRCKRVRHDNMGTS